MLSVAIDLPGDREILQEGIRQLVDLLSEKRRELAIPGIHLTPKENSILAFMLGRNEVVYPPGQTSIKAARVHTAHLRRKLETIQKVIPGIGESLEGTGIPELSQFMVYGANPTVLEQIEFILEFPVRKLDKALAQSVVALQKMATGLIQFMRGDPEIPEAMGIGSPSAGTVFNILLSKEGVVTPEYFHTAIYTPFLEEPRGATTVREFVAYVRRKIPEGATVETHWGTGYSMDAASKNIINTRIEEIRGGPPAPVSSPWARHSIPLIRALST